MSSDGEILALDVDHITKLGLITIQPVCFLGYLIDTDALNDVSVEIWNGDKTKVLFPKIVWDPTKDGTKQVNAKARYSKTGLWVNVQTKGYFRLIPLYQHWMS